MAQMKFCKRLWEIPAACFAWKEAALSVAALENEKHERFCEEYLIDLNGTQAAIRAGYKKRSAAAQASALLRNHEILARVRELRKERMDRLALNADFVVLELLNTYQKCQNPHPVMLRNEKTGKYEECGVYQFDSKGALKALELLDRHIGARGLGDSEKSNLLQQILDGTGGNVNTDDIPEIQQEAAPGDHLVE